MLKTTIILLITLVLFYVGIYYIAPYTGETRSALLGWMGIVLLAFIVERIIKRILLIPFQSMFKEVKGHRLANTVQNVGVTLSYLSLWLAVGVNPISAFVNGYHPEKWISTPLFLWLSGLFIALTILFSVMWVLTIKVSRR